MTTPTKRDVEIAKDITNGNYGLDFERALTDAIAQALAAERASLPDSVKHAIKDSCICIGRINVCWACKTYADLEKWMRGE